METTWKETAWKTQENMDRCSRRIAKKDGNRHVEKDSARQG